MATLKSYALTNLADVKESLHIPSGTTTYDNLIIRKINQATAAIENYCGRRFKATDYVSELYNATNQPEIVLRQRPVIVDVDRTFGIQARTTSLNLNQFQSIESDIYFVDQPSGVVQLLFNAWGRWGTYSISYSAGYDTIPDDLAEACVSLAAFYVNNADASGVGVSLKQEGQRKVQYASTAQDFNSVVKFLGIDQTLDVYANVAMFADK